MSPTHCSWCYTYQRRDGTNTVCCRLLLHLHRIGGLPAMSCWILLSCRQRDEPEPDHLSSRRVLPSWHRHRDSTVPVWNVLVQHGSELVTAVLELHARSCLRIEGHDVSWWHLRCWLPLLLARKIFTVATAFSEVRLHHSPQTSKVACSVLPATTARLDPRPHSNVCLERTILAPEA